MTADPTTWTMLKTSLGNWTNRTDLDTTEIPEAIALAERRFQRVVLMPEREVSYTATVTTQATALPTDLWGIVSVFADATTDIVLEKLTASDLRTKYPTAATGTPMHYAIEGENILIGPIPSSSTIRLAYIQTIPTLGAGQATNWLLTDHPDLYLWASLHELYMLLLDQERATLYEAKTQQVLDEMMRAYTRRKSGGPLRAGTLLQSVRNIAA